MADIEYGWMIERTDGGTLYYWMGGKLWSTNNLDGVRFVRRVDAARVAERMPARLDVRVLDHQWG